MPKQQQSIRDFSGGIADGVNTKDLKENQLVECKNFIADGIGRLSTVPGTREASAVGVVSELPEGNAKNIHGWTADLAFEYTGQESGNNIEAPTITEVQVAKRASIDFWHSTSYLMALNPFVKSLVIHNIDRDHPVLTWLVEANSYKNTYDNLDLNPPSAYDQSWAKGRSVKALEVLANQHTINPVYPENAIPWKWKTVSSSNKVSHAPSEMTNATQENNDGLTDSAVGANLNGNRFVVEKVSDNATWGSNSTTHPVWKMTLEFDYWGKINYSIEGTWGIPRENGIYYGYRPNTSNPSIVATHGVSHRSIDLNSSNPTTSNFNSRNGATFIVNNGIHEHTDVYGAYSKFSLNMVNISYYKTHKYTLNIQVYKDVEQTTFDTINLEYRNDLGEQVDDVFQGLLGGGENRIIHSGYSQDQAIYWERHDGGVYLFQNSDTEKPYGIKQVTIARTQEVNASSSLSDGERYQHLVAIANKSAQASVYSMETDNWLPWSIDLREDTSVTTDNKGISFFDVEGYLTASCMAFKTNNIPQWFGYLDINKTYCLATMTPSTDFFSTKFSPTPYKQIVTTGLTANQNSTNDSASAVITNSHQAVDWFSAEAVWSGVTGWISGAANSFKNLDDDDNNKIRVLRHSKSYIGSESFGLRVFCQFFDDQNAGTNGTVAGVPMIGTFKKDNPVHFYYSYIYEGGYVSQPIRISCGVGATANQEGFPSSFAPKSDSVSMGINVVIGKQLIGGDGNNNILNLRLKGVEIWAKYTKSDPSNLYLITEIDLNKGYRSNLDRNWKSLSNYYFGSSSVQSGYSTGDFTASSSDKYKTDYLIFSEPNLIESFRNRYGLDYQDNIGFDQGGTGWKTACVFNRKAFYGNIRIVGKDGKIEYKPDAILKSAPSMYGTVGISTMIEATINDGDEIVSLQVVGNKLMQFKKYSLTIMGIKQLENGETSEIIEQVIHHSGVLSESQICKTPYGLFWVSRSGIYIYNGQSITKLSETKNGNLMSKKDWETFYGERTMCGYDAYWNHVIIPRTNLNNNKTFIYSFNTGAFTTTTEQINGLKTSGFIQTRTGHVMYAQEIAEAGSSITKSQSNTSDHSAGATNSTINQNNTQ